MKHKTSLTQQHLLGMALLLTLGTACTSKESTDTTPAKKMSPTAVSGINSAPYLGVNGIRAQLTANSSWESSHCANVVITNTHPTATTHSWQAVIDLGLAQLSQSSGGTFTGNTGFVTIASTSSNGQIAPNASVQASFCATAPAQSREPVVVSINSDLPAISANEYEIGLWRIASRATRHTMGWTGSGFVGGSFTGHPNQQWRLKNRGGNTYSLTLESQGLCLSNVGSNASITPCANTNTTWTLDTLRVRSEDRPALYRLRNQTQTCLRQNGTTVPDIGACDVNANLYIEPVGYGERAYPVEYDLRALLMVKPSTNVANPRMIGTIPTDTIAAAQVAYKDHLAVWFNRMTDGRIKWMGESVVASPMTAATTEGGNRLPAAFTMQNDVQKYLPTGKYDTAAVFYTSGVDEFGNSVPGGWGWGPGISPESNYTMWVTVNGGATPAWQWTSWQNEPMEVFIHEPMHGLDAYFDQLGVSLQEGYLHGAEDNLYGRDQDGFMPWYRDILLGTVIGSDDTYRGYGPRAFRLTKPREAAAKFIKRTVVFMYGQTADGQDMFLRGGIDHAAAQTFMGKTCTQANMFCAVPITHRNLKNATTNPWKTGDAYLDWYGKEPNQNLSSGTHGFAEGTPADWTTNLWTFGNPVRTVATDGYGQEPLNKWGSHYWMLDVDMDCSKGFLDPRDGVTRWVEIKSYISNGPGWEGNVTQADRPYASGNHFAKCGKINKFERGSSAVQYFDF